MLSSNKPFLSSKIPKSGIHGHHELSKVSSVNARNFNFKTLPGNLPIHCYCRYQGFKRSGLSPFVCPDFQPKPSYDITVNIRFIFDNLSFNFINKLELYNYIRYWNFYRKQPPYGYQYHMIWPGRPPWSLQLSLGWWRFLLMASLRRRWPIFTSYFHHQWTMSLEPKALQLQRCNIFQLSLFWYLEFRKEIFGWRYFISLNLWIHFIAFIVVLIFVFSLLLVLPFRSI